jgi:hypothetical protein
VKKALEGESKQYKGRLLTVKRDSPFILCFKYPLARGYTFSELEKRNNKEFQNFLDKVSKMTVQQVDTAYARQPDKNDTFNSFQVYHYAVTESFRIHVINEAGRYKIIRLDPNHKINEHK